MAHMTVSQFMSRLRKTPRVWAVNKKGEIRSDLIWCPIQLVGRAFIYTSVERGFQACARRLGLTDIQTIRIAEAADCPDRDPVMRRKLLVSCGLIEAKK